MKKIYNYIPLQSVLYTIGGNEHIKIVDIEDIRWKEYTTKRVVYDGLMKNFHEATIGNRYKVERATLYGVDTEDGTIVFTICLRTEY